MSDVERTPAGLQMVRVRGGSIRKEMVKWRVRSYRAIHHTNALGLKLLRQVGECRDW
jgi:hypothetical protein